jgi:hypothetical protein
LTPSILVSSGFSFLRDTIIPLSALRYKCGTGGAFEAKLSLAINPNQTYSFLFIALLLLRIPFKSSAQILHNSFTSAGYNEDNRVARLFDQTANNVKENEMLKKILIGVGLTVLVGLLVAGAVIRTVDRTGSVAQAQGEGRGQGRSAETTGILDQAVRGNGQGRFGSDGEAITQGGYGGQGRTDAPGDGTGTGQAQVDEWITLQGTVASVDADTLVVEVDGDEQVIIENRAWWFAQDEGFTTSEGNELSILGFYEDGDFEAGQISDLTAGKSVTIRDENGRPGWAGHGRRGA